MDIFSINGSHETEIFINTNQKIAILQNDENQIVELADGQMIEVLNSLLKLLEQRNGKLAEEFRELVKGGDV